MKLKIDCICDTDTGRILDYDIFVLVATNKHHEQLWSFFKRFSSRDFYKLTGVELWDSAQAFSVSEQTRKQASAFIEKTEV